MENKVVNVYTCPTCGAPLESDGMAYRCDQHGLWYMYSPKLLVRAPNNEHKVRDRFTMPWEALPQAT